MKIKLFLLIPTLTIGGSERFMLSLASNINYEKFDVTLVLINNVGGFSDYQNDNIKIIDLKTPYVRKSIFKIIKLLYKHKPDVVLSTLAHLNMMLAIFKIFFPRETKFIGRESSFVSVRNKKNKYTYLYNIMYKFIYVNLDLIIAQSESMKQDLCINYKMNSNKISTINNFVDMDRINQMSDSKKKLFKRNKFNLIAVGRLEKVKGYERLIHVAKKLGPGFHITIIGDGSERRSLLNLIQELDLEDKVTLLGFKTNPYKYMRQSDCLILTSSYEGFPNVLLEANACGIPIMAFNCPGGVAEIINENVNGFLIEHGNVIKMSEKLNEIKNFKFDNKLIKEYIKNKYSKNKIIESYETIIIKSMEKRNASVPKIVIFNAIYLLPIFEVIYTSVVKLFLTKRKSNITRLVVVRNDNNKAFIENINNISSTSIDQSVYELQVLGFKFYQYLYSSGSRDSILFGKVPLYDLFTRQIKQKLIAVVTVALQIQRWSSFNEKNVEVSSDAQTIEMIIAACNFLKIDNQQIKWKKKRSLTLIITINSLIMRFAAILKTKIAKSTLPSVYYSKQQNLNNPTALVTLPNTQAEAFFESYVKNIKNINIILYSLAELKKTPKDFKISAVDIEMMEFSGRYNFDWCSVKSYIADILLIHSKHEHLKTCLNVVQSIFQNEKIDFLINRQQVHIVDNYFTIMAKELKIPVIGDVFEEIYYCDAAIIHADFLRVDLVKEVLGDREFIVRGNNEFMKYRMHISPDIVNNYLALLLNINDKKIIFYASDPGKNERQRYELECFLMKYFARLSGTILVIKTHHGDDGGVTLLAYNSSNRPDNIKLIGDIARKSNMPSNEFSIFSKFDFHSALRSSDGFMTAYSSSALEAILLGVKVGILDTSNHGYLRPLVDKGGAFLISDEESLECFLGTTEYDISEDALEYYGLKNKPINDFDLGRNLLDLVSKVNN